MILKNRGPAPLTAAQFDACRPYLRLGARSAAAAENVLVWNATQSSIARHMGLHRQAVNRAVGTVRNVAAELGFAVHDDSPAGVGRATTTEDGHDARTAADSGSESSGSGQDSVLAGAERP